jgi:hypothetical protein
MPKLCFPNEAGSMNVYVIIYSHGTKHRIPCKVTCACLREIKHAQKTKGDKFQVRVIF